MRRRLPSASLGRTGSTLRCQVRTGSTLRCEVSSCSIKVNAIHQQNMKCLLPDLMILCPSPALSTVGSDVAEIETLFNTFRGVDVCKSDVAALEEKSDIIAKVCLRASQ